MATLTRAADVEGDINVSVGTTDFVVGDGGYETDDAEVIQWALNSTLVDVDAAPPVADKPVVTVTADTTDHHEGALS